jgi:fluoride exporter
LPPPLVIALGGALGALSRYALGTAVQRASGGAFPLGTFIVNIVGCLLYGAIYGWLQKKLDLSPQVQLALLTGFMGAFTTFSTYAHETVKLLQDGRIGLAVINVVGQTVIGLLFIFAGLRLTA